MERRLPGACFSQARGLVGGLDARVQLEILSACVWDARDGLGYLLHLVERLAPEAEAPLLARAADRMVKGVANRIAADGQLPEGGTYQDVIWSWYAQHVAYWRFVFHLARALPPSIGGALRVEILRSNLDHAGGPDDLSTEDLCGALNDEFCGMLAGGADHTTLETMRTLLLRLLHPSASFGIATGVERLRALVRCALALLERQSAVDPNRVSAEQPFLPLFCSAVARFKEASAVHLVAEFSSPRGNPNENSEEEKERIEAVLEDIATLGRCVNAATVASCMSSCPMWILSLSQAVDDRDRRERIKRAIVMN
ncbi:unnamed protein product [Phytomonas sp. EM1]|nr:unnamed protein product [Phytomonas sp. EM1]|eukprot:CCW59797.1 unnamed protein product [Phytomonas sp. isolate EM1]